MLLIECVKLFGSREAAQLFDHLIFQIRSNYIIFTIVFLEVRYEFGSYLTSGTYNKYTFHINF